MRRRPSASTSAAAEAPENRGDVTHVTHVTLFPLSGYFARTQARTHTIRLIWKKRHMRHKRHTPATETPKPRTENMIEGLISGKLHNAPPQRQTRNGNTFTTCKARVPTGEDAAFCNVVAFSETAQFALAVLSPGVPVSTPGELKVSTWTDKAGTTRQGADGRRRQRAALDRLPPAGRWKPCLLLGPPGRRSASAAARGGPCLRTAAPPLCAGLAASLRCRWAVTT